MADHPGNYIGGHSSIDPNTRKIVVAELRALADRIGGTDYGRVAAQVLHNRADEIEFAGRKG